MIRSRKARFAVNPSVAPVMVDVKSAGPDDGLTLSRWSRLKRRGGETAVAPSTEAPAAPEVANEATLPTAGAADAANVAELNLPQLSSISLVEDFTPFMQAKVPQVIRQQALKALFKEPHFNVMDGLDTYIDDYTVFEPITPEVMATLSSWKTIMNPAQQVVTPRGYAVDVESEEGKAVLAARAKAESLAVSRDGTMTPPPPGGGGAGGEGDCDASVVVDSSRLPPPLPNPLPRGEKELHAAPLPKSSANTPATVILAQHPRHNKRVGDFTYVETPEVPPPGAEKAE